MMRWKTKQKYYDRESMVAETKSWLITFLSIHRKQEGRLGHKYSKATSSDISPPPPKDSIFFPSSAANWRQSVQTPEAFRKFSTKPPQILMDVLLRVLVKISRKDCVKHICILNIVISFKNACSTQNV